MIAIQDLINNSIKETNDARRKDYKQTSWHISSLGSCLRGIYLKRAEAKPDTEMDERTLRVFDVGNKIEDWVVELLKTQDIKVETQVRAEDKELNVSGYADVVVENKDGKEVLEIKSKHSRSFWWMEKKKQGAQRSHQYQLWMYLWLLNIERGRIIYVSKDDLSILEYPIFRNDESLKKECFEQLEFLNKAWKAKDPSILPLPENGKWGNQNDFQSKYCSFHKQCVKVGEIK